MHVQTMHLPLTRAGGGCQKALKAWQQQVPGDNWGLTAAAYGLKGGWWGLALD